MKKQEELQIGCSIILKKLRLDAGLSVNKMAETVMIDRRTWQKYEDGISAPTLPEFIRIFDVMGKSAMKMMLDYLYPDIYKDISPQADEEDLRKAAAHFFMNVAPEKVVREFDYLVLGNHGSNMYPQFQEFTMYNHLPLEMRYIIANLINSFWDIATNQNRLIDTDNIMPDVEGFRQGLEKGRKAVIEGKISYTTITK